MEKENEWRGVLRLEVTVNDLADHKRRLLEASNVRTEFNLPLECAVEPLRAARITSLSKVGCCMSAFLVSVPVLARQPTCTAQDELHTLQTDDDFLRPINPRNEAAALAILLGKLGRHGELLPFHCACCTPTAFPNACSTLRMPATCVQPPSRPADVGQALQGVC